MIEGFKAFIMRGNVLDLAVAVVIGAAFTQIVNSLVDQHHHPAHRSDLRHAGLLRSHLHSKQQRHQLRRVH